MILLECYEYGEDQIQFLPNYSSPPLAFGRSGSHNLTQLYDSTHLTSASEDAGSDDELESYRKSNLSTEEFKFNLIKGNIIS